MEFSKETSGVSSDGGHSDEVENVSIKEGLRLWSQWTFVFGHRHWYVPKLT